MCCRLSRTKPPRRWKSFWLPESGSFRREDSGHLQRVAQSEAVAAHDSLHACGPALGSLAGRCWKPNLSSPAEGVDLPRQPRRFTVVDVDRSSGSSPRLQDIRMKFVSFAFTTGMCPSEYLALTWSVFKNRARHDERFEHP
jgi:hypothetical protein